MEPDEFEFGYQVWRRNPDRIVGFPPRSHFINEHGELEYDAGRFLILVLDKIEPTLFRAHFRAETI